MKLNACLFFTLLLTHVKTRDYLAFCPIFCDCTKWITRSISCFEIEVMPTFHPATKELWLVGTRLHSVPQDAFANLANLSKIYISDDESLRVLEMHSFHSLPTVTHIEIRSKTLTHINEKAFKDLPNLKYLWLVGTRLHSVPQDAFANLANLSKIYISDDESLRVLEMHSFHSLPTVTHIEIRSKTLTHINEKAFKDLPNLKYLWLVGTRLHSVPQDAFANLANLSKIYISDDESLRVLEMHSFHSLPTVTHIEIRSKTLTHINEKAFKDLPNLKYLWLVGTRLHSVPQDAFANLANLSKIYISDDESLRVLEMHSFHSLPTVTHIEIRSKTLTHINEKAFKDLPNLKYLGILNTGLHSFPVLKHIQSHREEFILEIVDNIFMKVIPSNSFTGISVDILTLILNSNGLTEIQPYAFNGSRLEEVYLQENVDLERVHERAFFGVISGPTLLDISGTRVSSLPTTVLGTIETLRATNTRALKKLPPFRLFSHLQSAELTFPSHCCGLQNQKRWRGHIESFICNLTKAKKQRSRRSSGPFPPIYEEYPQPPYPNATNHTYDDQEYYHTYPNERHTEGLQYVEFPTDSPIVGFDYTLCDDNPKEGHTVTCTPMPDAFNPCEDVMSLGFLRVSVWVVSLLAVTANLLVMLILLSSQRKLSITRLLIFHLAFADLCMGVYLVLIASVDLHTRTQYHRFAIAWQTGAGCSLAGALTVFASELSVYTLTAITLQRWYAITFAMRPERKLLLRHAAILMLAGWLLCLLLALLPLIGVSSYQRVSICLPMDTESTLAQAYVVSLLMLNVLAFVVVCLCYIHIYCMVHNPQHLSSRGDASMAKRMAVLIFTNFLCLAPISFYGLSAALHHPLITVTDSKVLLVLFYPLNSCANPFLYAILTRAFHGDALMLLSRMGLCRHKAQLYRSQQITASQCASRKTRNAPQSRSQIPELINLAETATCGS